MPALYLYVTDTLADWEPGHILAELHSGRYLKDPARTYTVIPCGISRAPVITMGGIRITPQELIGDIRPGEGDLLLLPGADTWLDPLHGPCLEKVREVLSGNAVVAAICGATLGLANAGFLDRRPHTSNDPAVLKMFCPGYRGKSFYVNEPAVTDGNLITASGLAPVEFAYQVLKRLDVMSPATLAAWHGLFTTRQSGYFFQLMESLPRQRGDSGNT